MPTAARSVKREHVESYIAARRETVKPTTLSIEFRSLQQFFKWALEEEEIDRSPMEKMRAPTVPRAPVPVVDMADFRKLLKTAEGNGYNPRRDTLSGAWCPWAVVARILDRPRCACSIGLAPAPVPDPRSRLVRPAPPDRPRVERVRRVGLFVLRRPAGMAPPVLRSRGSPPRLR